VANPGNQGWRSGAAPKGDKKKRDWRSDTASPGAKVRWGRLLKFGAGFGIITALIVTIILLFFVADETKVNVVALGPQEYSYLDVPLAGLTASSLVDDWTGETEVQVFTEAKTDGSGFVLPAITEKRAIIYVRAVAISTPKGVLLCEKSVRPSTFGNDNAAGGVLLKNLVQRLIEVKAQKLVLLDISPVREHWQMGSFAVDFMSELREKSADAAKSGTVFLTASNVGEQSWRSRTFGGQSVFRHFVRRGLLGEATDSEYVRVSQLVRYVKENTRDWAFQRRETFPGQHPQCVPPLDDLDERLDFTLANVAMNEPLPAPTAPDGVSERKRLSELWTQRSQLAKSRRQSSVAWRKLTDELLLLERRVALGLNGAVTVNSKAVAALSTNPLNSALNQNAWFRHAVLPRLNDAARPSSSEIQLPEDVLDQNIKWFNSQRRTTNQREITRDEKDAATKLQTTAENAHANSAGILPFVRAELDKADLLRRRAHDLLFTAAIEEPVSVDGETLDGRAAMSAAQAANDAALDAVQAMRVSHNALLDAVADLPYLARFAAASMPSGDSATLLLKKTQEEAASQSLFKYPESPRTSDVVDSELRAVTALLGGAESGEIAALFAATRELAVRFGHFDIQKAKRELQRGTGLTPDGERDETQVQKINRLGAAVATRLARLKTRLMREAQGSGWQKEQANAEDRRNIVRYLELPFLAPSVREGMLDQLIKFESSPLGAPTEATSSGGPEETAWLIRSKWQAFWALQVSSLNPGATVLGEWGELATSTEPSDTCDKLAAIGTDLRFRADRQSKALSTGSDEDSTTAGVAEEGTRLRRADYLSRLLPRFGADYIGSRSTGQSVPAWQAAQTFAVAEFALHYGRRLEQDFLRDASSDSDEAWFRNGIDHARQLAAKHKGRRLTEYSGLAPRDSEVRLQLADQAALDFKRRDTSLPLSLALQESGLPESVKGIAAVWSPVPDTGPSVTPVSNGIPILVGGEGVDAVLNLKRNTAAEGCNEGHLAVDLFFRGHVSSRSFEVDPCTSPDSTLVLQARPATGAVNVIGRKHRSIVFVLDWSESMIFVKGEGPNKRYEQAIAALKMAMAGLRDEDAVGFVMFGHRGRVGADGETLEVNRKALADYQKAPPASWMDAQVLVKVQPKALAEPAINKLLEKLETVDRLKPYGNTPLYQAIDIARRELPEGGAIIVVSDGDPDDAADSDLEENLERKNIVATAIQFQFSGALEEFIRTVAAEEANLGQKIRDAIPPREYTLRREAAQRTAQRSLLNEQIKVPAGTYDLGFGESRIRSLQIGGGELHEYELSLGELRRVIPDCLDRTPAIADKPPGAQLPRELGHTRFTIVDTTATIDVSLNHSDDRQPIVWPAEIEFAMWAEGQVPVTNLNVQFVANKASPTYRLTTRKWPPRRGRVQVQAWWKIERTPVEVRVSWSDLKKGSVETEAVGGLPALKITARRSDVPQGIVVNVEAKELPAAGPDPIAGLRVEPGFTSGARGFALLRARKTEVQRWSDSAAAEFLFEIDPNSEELQFGITSRKALRRGATTVKPILRNPGNAQSGSSAKPD